MEQEDEKMQKKYGAMYGKNGLGVYDDMLRADESMKYLIQPKCRAFKSLADAIAWAKEGYNNILMDEFALDGYYEQADMKLNWLYFRKNLAK